MSPFLTCLDFGVCAPQSASFALAKTHSLDVLLNASRPYRRSPLKGNPRRPLCGGHTQHSHRLLSFPFYVTRSRTKKIQTRPLTCTLLQARRSLSRRLAARVPSFKLHIPCIRTLRIGVRSGVGVPPITATKLQYHLRKAQISLLP